MRRLLRLGLVLLAVVVFTRATCGQRRAAGVTPVQKMEFTDHVCYHNMGITWDGEYYYTINGGNTQYSSLNQYDAGGSLEESYDLGVDARAVVYDPVWEEIFVKPYGSSLHAVDLDLVETSEDLEDIFGEDQSSVAMSPDGEKLYELSNGRVRVYDTNGGDEEASFELSSHSEAEELGYAYAVAASDKFLFVWAPDGDTDILVYDLDGKYVTKFTLPRSGYGFSLSWANGMLWIAEDADGGTDGADGTWYGYELQGLE